MPEREMIGDYKGEVKNKVVTALFQAYMDVLDYDGLKSILKEAELLELKNSKGVDPEMTLDFFFSFHLRRLLQLKTVYYTIAVTYCLKLEKNSHFIYFPLVRNLRMLLKKLMH